MNIDRPYMFLILIPALILGIVPFFRLHKKRRMSSKHLIPFIIHLTLILLLSAVLAGVRITETSTAPSETRVVFVVDASDSNRMKFEEMNQYMHSFTKAGNRKTKYGLVVFGGTENEGIIHSVQIGDLDEKVENYLDLELPSEVNYSETNVAKALAEARAMLSYVTERCNKRIVLLSDGRQTQGNAFVTAKEIANAGIKLDAAYFNIGDGKLNEMQVVSLSTPDEIDYQESFNVEVTINTTTANRVTITLYNDDNTVASTKTVKADKGFSTHELPCTANNAGINIVRATITPEEGDDTIAPNNEYYSWYKVTSKGNILVVDGDGSQFKQIEKTTNIDLTGYEVRVIGPASFPKTLEELLQFDEVILMNVNFIETDVNKRLPSTAPVNLKRYVEEVGRGVLVTCGSNIYNGTELVGTTIDELLPVELKVDNEKQTVAMVLVIDLSSSMKELMGDQTRYQIVLDSAQEVIRKNGFEETDFVGVVAFDQDSHVALEIQPLGDEANREKICETLKYNLDHYYYAHYLNLDGTESDIRINVNNDGEPGKGNIYVDGENPLYKLPENYSRGGQDKVTGDYIKTYGTSYKWAIQEASDMLSKASQRESIEVKQVILMSDGAPNDQGSGYEGLIERMAKSGTITSTMAIGTNDAKCISELENLSVKGNGALFKVDSAEQLDADLTKIAESIEGKLFNENLEYGTQPKRRDTSIIHTGMDNVEYDFVYGYYGTTLKKDERAKLVLYVDNGRPLYAEWKYGLGQVSVLMTDLGNPKWTGELFNDKDGKANSVLVKNILLAPMHNAVDSSGLEYSVVRDEASAKITINTYTDLRETDKNANLTENPFGYKEIIHAKIQLIDENGKLVDMGIDSKGTSLIRGGKPIVAKAEASRKYSVTIPTTSLQENYIVTLEMVKCEEIDVGGTVGYVQLESFSIVDTTTLAVEGRYSKEYNVLNDNGQIVIQGIAANGGGGMLEDDDDALDNYFDSIQDETVIYEHDITTPALIIAAILFVLDIVFRNFVITRKKEKDSQMTDEEQIASMRGR